MTNEFAGFPPALLRFLAELEINNQRDWFNANKGRYEQNIVAPGLAFISAMATELARFAPRFRALPLRSGGSLMRIYRDTRFARDKKPYKTNDGITVFVGVILNVVIHFFAYFRWWHPPIL